MMDYRSRWVDEVKARWIPVPPLSAVVITLSGEQEEGELQVDSTGWRFGGSCTLLVMHPSTTAAMAWAAALGALCGGMGGKRREAAERSGRG